MPESPESTTRTVVGARGHARSLAASAAAAVVTTQPTVPVSAAVDLPPGVAADDVVWDETFGPGGYAARVVRRGAHLLVTDVAGGANVSVVLHHAGRPAERLNVADTVKLQWNAYLGPGALLLSDMGRVLATIGDPTTGPLDLLCGASLPEGRSRLLLGLARHDLTRRDLPPAANLFGDVRVAADGGLHRSATPSPVGATVVLRAELDLLVTLAVAPHPLDDAPSDGVLVRVTAWAGAPAGPDDPARHTSPEAQRAFENTDDVLLSFCDRNVAPEHHPPPDPTLPPFAATAAPPLCSGGSVTEPDGVGTEAGR